MIRRGLGGSMVALMALVSACSQKASAPVARSEPPPAFAADTLLAELAPHLEPWIAMWRFADRSATIGSFHPESDVPFTLHDIHRYDMHSPEEARRRRLFVIYAPDSTRFVDPDTRFDVALDDRTVAITRGPDSSPALVDLKTRSTSGLETSWHAGDCDGAFWLGNERFAITGTSPGLATDGSRYGFVRVFDLDAGTVVEYQTDAAPPQALRLFLAARDSIRTAKFRKVLY